MKAILRNIAIYTIVGFIFTCIIVFIYDKHLKNIDIILQGTLLFMIITILMERIMLILYVKVRIYPIIRVQLTVIIGVGLYTLGVWITRPWLLSKIFNLPIFLITIFPMFIIFGVVFEFYYQNEVKNYNEKLLQLKMNKKS